MITTHYDYGSYSTRPATNTFALFWLLCCFELCRPDLGLIFRRSLTWHLHISTLHHRAVSIINALKKLRTFFPGINFLYSIVYMFGPSLIMVILFLITVRLLTLISLKAFKLLQLNLSLVASGAHPTRLFWKT